MGLGDMFSSIFGGGNSYRNVNSPIMGSPRREGESAEDYQRRLYADYQRQQAARNRGITTAGNLQLPQNVLNFAGAQPAMNQLGSLGQMLMAQSRGEGPNPALEQLKQTTNANIANQAALAASSRGVNPALAMRQAGNTGAAINQQAAGQAALQSAQQQLAAQQAAGGLYGNLANLAQQQAMAQGQAGLGILGQRGQLEAQRMQDRYNQMSLLQNAYNAMNNINAGVAAQNANTAGQYGQGIMGGISSGIGLMAMDKGGLVPDSFVDAVRKKGMKMAGGGLTQFQAFQGGDPLAAQLQMAPEGGTKMMNEGLEKAGAAGGSALNDFLSSKFGTGFPSGPPSIASGLDMGSLATPQLPRYGFGATAPSFTPSLGAFEAGGFVPGRAEVKEDSEKNDTVPALLSPGEIVIPRSAAENPEAAHDFLDKILKQKRKVTSYGDVLRAQRLWYGGCADGK